MKYNVIANPKLDSLIEEVNLKLIDGWEPTGSLIVEHNEEGGVMFLQPIIKN